MTATNKKNFTKIKKSDMIWISKLVGKAFDRVHTLYISCYARIQNVFIEGNVAGFFLSPQKKNSASFFF